MYNKQYFVPNIEVCKTYEADSLFIQTLGAFIYK
jgi:hypothetical protein